MPRGGGGAGGDVVLEVVTGFGRHCNNHMELLSQKSKNKLPIEEEVERAEAWKTL